MSMISSVSSLYNSSATSGASSTSGRGYDELGQADFFRLLTVQIQNQDPLDPVDNKEMLAQMAQFTSLSGINDVNTTLEEISGKFDTLTSTNAQLAEKIEAQISNSALAS